MPRIAWIGLFLGIAASSACWIFVGANLGLFFGGIVAATLLVPPMSLTRPGLTDRLLIAFGVCDGIALVWLAATLFAPISFVQWLLSYALLICWCLALAGVAHLLTRLIRPIIIVSAITVLIAFLWLTWPIWFSQLNSPFLLSVHPLLSLNGVLRSLQDWTHRPLAYQYLLRLNQDVSFEMSRNIASMAIFHSILGTACVLLGNVAGKR